jgi:hypothetical protein
MLITSERIDIDINRKQVCRHIGYSGGYKTPARILSLVDEYIEHAHQLIEPSYSYVIRDIKWIWGFSVCIEGSIIFESQVIAQLLAQCHKVAVFLATIGKHLEETACQLAEEGLIVQSAVLDAIGSDAVESVADFVRGRIGEVANDQGFVISQRFSPGYCDWDVGQQEAVFQAVANSSTGIRLTERCLMIPQKSISGIIGIGPPDGSMVNYNPCQTCNKYDCQGRR